MLAQLNNGDCTFSPSFQLKMLGSKPGDHMTYGFKPPKGEQFVSMLLGTVPKDAVADQVDLKKLLSALGLAYLNELKLAISFEQPADSELGFTKSWSTEHFRVEHEDDGTVHLKVNATQAELAQVSQLQAALHTMARKALKSSKMDAGSAAITYALSIDDERDGMNFLRLWHAADFEVIRREYPDAPEAVFEGADGTLASTSEDLDFLCELEEMVGAEV